MLPGLQGIVDKCTPFWYVRSIAFDGTKRGLFASESPWMTWSADQINLTREEREDKNDCKEAQNSHLEL